MWKRLECKFSLRVFRAAVWKGRGWGQRGGKRCKESVACQYNYWCSDKVFRFVTEPYLVSKIQQGKFIFLQYTVIGLRGHMDVNVFRHVRKLAKSDYWHPSVWNNSASTGRIFTKFGIWDP
jgi:hypothetical protein